MMGATRPNAKQMAYAHARIVGGWSDPRRMYMSDKEIAADNSTTGYDPNMRRKTCSGCKSLTWHNNGKCTECGNE